MNEELGIEIVDAGQGLERQVEIEPLRSEEEPALETLDVGKTALFLCTCGRWGLSPC